MIFALEGPFGNGLGTRSMNVRSWSKAHVDSVWTSDQVVTNVPALRTKGWDLTEPEIEWLVRQLSAQLAPG